MLNLVAKIDHDLIDLAPSFVENRKAELPKLKIAIETKDLETVRWINHDLRGVALPYGFQGLNDLSVELNTVMGDFQRMGEVVAKIEFYLDHVKFEKVV